MIEDDRGTLRAVAWSELFPLASSGPLLPAQYRTAAFAAGVPWQAVAMILGWSVIGLLFSGNAEIAAQHEGLQRVPLEHIRGRLPTIPALQLVAQSRQTRSPQARKVPSSIVVLIRLLVPGNTSVDHSVKHSP